MMCTQIGRDRRQRRPRIARWKATLLLLIATTCLIAVTVAGIVHICESFTGLVIVKSDTLIENEDMVAIVKAQNQQIIDKQKGFETALAEKDAEISDLKAQLSMLQNDNAALRTIPAVVTAYAPLDPASIKGFDYMGDGSITATGTKVRVGVCAADLSRIPAGTTLYIPGYGVATVEDTGGAMRAADGILLDIVFDTREEAFDWGRRSLDVIVLSVPEEGE